MAGPSSPSCSAANTASVQCETSLFVWSSTIPPPHPGHSVLLLHDRHSTLSPGRRTENLTPGERTDRGESTLHPSMGQAKLELRLQKRNGQNNKEFS